jgi:hypothetical protein
MHSGTRQQQGLGTHPCQQRVKHRYNLGQQQGMARNMSRLAATREYHELPVDGMYCTLLPLSLHQAWILHNAPRDAGGMLSYLHLAVLMYCRITDEARIQKLVAFQCICNTRPTSQQ